MVAMTPPLIDYAAERKPQRFRCWKDSCTGPIERPCPLHSRAERKLLSGEGPHALSWLAHRGDTVRLLGWAFEWSLGVGGRANTVRAHDEAQYERIRCGRRSV